MILCKNCKKKINTKKCVIVYGHYFCNIKCVKEFEKKRSEKEREKETYE
jgi:hypothetical protein